MKYASILLFLFLLSTLSCNKEKLTKPTQKGANTFSCLIDGEIYKPCPDQPIIGSPGDPALNGGVYKFSNWISVSVSASGCGESGAWDKNVYLEIAKFMGQGTYSLSDLSNRMIYSVNEYNGSRAYSSLNTKSGKIIITKDDRVNKILSGTFEFDGIDNSEPSVIIKITSGRFDIKYK